MEKNELLGMDVTLYEFMKRLCNLRMEEKPNYYGHMLPTLIFNDTDEELDYDDFTGIDIEDTPVTLNGEDMICDGLIIFGDGAIELHDKEDMDSYNWSEFGLEDLKKIVEKLKEKLVSIQ